MRRSANDVCTTYRTFYYNLGICSFYQPDTFVRCFAHAKNASVRATITQNLQPGGLMRRLLVQYRRPSGENFNAKPFWRLSQVDIPCWQIHVHLYVINVYGQLKKHPTQ